MAFAVRTHPLLAMTCGAGVAMGWELLAVRATQELDFVSPPPETGPASESTLPVTLWHVQQAGEGLLKVVRALIRPSAEPRETACQPQLQWGSAATAELQQLSSDPPIAESALAFSNPWTAWRHRRLQKKQHAQGGAEQQSEGPEVVAPHAMAARFQPELQEIRRRLVEQGAPLSPDGLAGADTELMRFAFTAGLTHARTAEGRQEAVNNAVRRAAATAEWLTSHAFMPEQELQLWQHLVHWQGMDAEGQPILVLSPAAVLGQPRPPPLDRCAEAVISQVQAGIRQLVAEDADPTTSGMLAVVVDARGISGMQVMQLVWLIKEVALTLNAHFPGRLAALWIVEAPAVLKWPLKGLRKLLHPATGQKVQMCNADDPALPTGIAPSLHKRLAQGCAGEDNCGLVRVDGVHFWYV